MAQARETPIAASGSGNPLADTLEERQTRSRTGFRAMARAYAQDRFAVAAAIVLLTIAGASLLAPVLPLADPIDDDPTMRLEGMGTEGHILGLDYSGRDVLSRLIWGGRQSLPNAVVPVLIASVLALFLGLAAGYLGGFFDMTIMRATDVLFALPDIVLAIAIAAAMGQGRDSVILATTLVIIAPLTRMTYSAARQQSSSEYVIAARAIGAPFTRIIGRHLLPNVIAPVIIYASTIIGLLVVFTATLSFLGLGVPPPTPEWGLMVDEGRRVLSIAPHAATLPGIMIAITALSFNLVGDGLRYALDPRQHRH
jgi:ABC-type dipeptide/oligopeptide/nickel transport system permease subunit